MYISHFSLYKYVHFSSSKFDHKINLFIKGQDFDGNLLIEVTDGHTHHNDRVTTSEWNICTLFGSNRMYMYIYTGISIGTSISS